jgi:hypothetical protein
MKKSEFENNLNPCLGEFIDNEGDNAVLYIQFNEHTNSMEIGTVCNSGMLVDFTVPYDDDFSIDINLQKALDEILENGYNMAEAE